MSKISNTSKLRYKSKKQAYKNERYLAKMKNKSRAAGTKAVMKGLTETVSAITTPLSATRIAQSNDNRKIAQYNAEYNSKNYQKALDTWMDQMDGNPTSDGDKGSSGTKQQGSTTDQSKLGG